ncbi:DUF1765-domain-containing protein [Tothia fuscella]|uniref:DUF1765-domain-containing protein n=1 Tax=Tothia fuscella TaxID=1048955 RepID=A0A9P4NVU6_9PEZI|nr:DUF1765-domain-containing protein [Tothia fuscella]
MAAVEGYTTPPEYPKDKDTTFLDTVLSSGDLGRSLNALELNDVDLPRAASYTYFPTLNDTFLDAHELSAITSFTEEDLLPSSSTTEDASPNSSGGSSPDSDCTDPLELAIKVDKPVKSAFLRNSLPQLATANAASNKQGDSKIGIAKSSAAKNDELTHLPTPSNSLTSRLRRRSWMPASRSPSPRKSLAPDSPVDDSHLTSKALRASRRNSFRQSILNDSSDRQRSRSVSLSRKLSNKIRGRTAADDVVSPGIPVPVLEFKANHLPVSLSAEKLPALSVTRPIAITDRRPPVPRAPSRERNRLSKESTKKKDELWGVFRALDTDYQKFNSKPTALKTNVVRVCLLPFLKSYQSHPSLHKLRPEDLERRITILGKWWCGLLELLRGKANLSLSGLDRPIILQSILGLMERPEWRLAPSPFCPLSERASLADARSNSSASLSSRSSDYVLESVHHTMRNLFSRTLLDQMAFVAEEMDKSNTTASLVSFCGQTCAYAFFFCPGIAGVLVRQWGPSMPLLSRVVVECNLSRFVNLTDISKAIGSGFPPHLVDLQFTTLNMAYRRLRQTVPLPLGAAHLKWGKTWINRWCGLHSDLFYVFFKHYHVLLAEFLPSKATRTERLCAPGLIYVHAQLLLNMDNTIHPQPPPEEEGEDRRGPSDITFDDVLDGPNATARPLPLTPASNATRPMAENRLVMLLRDVLSNHKSNTIPAWPRQFTAQAFADCLKAAARRTSVFHPMKPTAVYPSPSYILCDLLEEAIQILFRYEQSSSDTILDWSFWFKVWRKMTESENTTVEIRMYTLLYSLWIPVTSDPTRKYELCSTFLLDPKFFQSRFNHWCPMVRAYFMRVLCWRVARYDGEGPQNDSSDIYDRLYQLLHEVYGHYLYLYQLALDSGIQLPSTSPCNPAPKRRFLIVRTDPILSPGRFLDRENLISQRGANHHGDSSLGELSNLDLRPESRGSSGTDSDPESDEKSPKKRWSLLQTIIGTSRQSQGPRTASPSPSRAGKESRSRNTPRSTAAGDVPTPRSLPDWNGQTQSNNSQHRVFSFKFSLEGMHHLNPRYQSRGPLRITPPRLPAPAQELLQASRPVSAHSSSTPSVSSANLTNGSEEKSLEVKGIQPVGSTEMSATYSGRSLAEWALVVGECKSFFERRKDEGVPSNRWVETPTLGVEIYKKPG